MYYKCYRKLIAQDQILKRLKQLQKTKYLTYGYNSISHNLANGLLTSAGVFFWGTSKICLIIVDSLCEWYCDLNDTFMVHFRCVSFVETRFIPMEWYRSNTLTFLLKIQHIFPLQPCFKVVIHLRWHYSKTTMYHEEKEKLLTNIKIIQPTTK